MTVMPSLARADWGDFIPRTLENGAFLDTFTSYERDHLRNDSRTTDWTDTFLREKLTVYTTGYSYHPRFLQYHFSLSGVAKQEDYEASLLPSLGWQYGSAAEYDARVFLLPEHAYNLKLWASRYEPLYKEQAATQHSAVENSRGAAFRYRKKPYFFNVTYTDDSIESGDTSSDVTRVGVDGRYFKRFRNGNELAFNGAFNPSWFSNSQGLDGTATEYLLGNFINLRRVRLDSSVTKNEFDQTDNSAQTFKNDQLAWYELATAYLPWNFRSDASYRFQDNRSTIDDPTNGRRKLTDTGDDIQFDLVHRLYESLDTTYTFLRDTRSSTGGDTTSLSNALALNYTKSIPVGRVLAGVNVARNETDNRGQTDIVNEPYSGVAVPGSFLLRQQNVQPGSVTIFLKSPLPPFEAIPLVENVDYTLTPVQNTVQVNMITLPSQFVVPGTYDLLISYSLTSGDFGLRTDTFGSGASAQLFDDLLTPYFNYLTVRSDVTSGTFLGTPIDSTTYTTGLIVHRGSVRARGEYQRLEWQVSPYQAWRAELQYVASLSRTTSAYATLAYLNKYYPHGTSVNTTGAFTEQSESASASVQKRLLTDMFISAGGSYSRLQGLVDSNAYSANASWTWHIGKVDVSVGASAYASDSSASGGISTERDHQLVYMKLRRRLF